MVFLKNCVFALSVRVVVASKIIANRLIVEKYSNVEVTGDPLEAVAGAGMGVIESNLPSLKEPSGGSFGGPSCSARNQEMSNAD